jgi:hypothetical protein
MTYNVYNPDVLYPMFFNTLHIRPFATYDNCFSVYEQLGAILTHVNEAIKETNDMGEALKTFENYVLEALKNNDTKIQQEITTILNGYIADGTIANLINTVLLGNINTDITNLKTNVTNLMYSKPSGNISISPSQEIYNVGESINSTLVNYSLIKGSDNISEIKLYRNGTIINTVTTPPLNGVITDGTVITDNTEYYITVNDSKNIIQSNKIDIKFVYDFYMGVVSDVNVDESLIKSLTANKTIKQNLSFTFNTNNQKIVFSYPSSYGDLLSIIDTENYDMIDGFTKSIVTVNSISYNVYVSNNFIYDNNVNLKFEF